MIHDFGLGKLCSKTVQLGYIPKLLTAKIMLVITLTLCSLHCEVSTQSSEAVLSIATKKLLLIFGFEVKNFVMNSTSQPKASE